MKRIGTIVVAAACLLASACGITGASRPGWGSNPVVYGKPKIAVDGQPPSGSAKLIFLRPPSTGAGDGGGNGEVIANLYVNDRYLGSLRAGAYVVGQTCAGATRLAAVFDDAGLDHEGKYDADRMIDLDSGKTYYLRIDSHPSGGAARGASEITVVDGSRMDLGAYKAQTHAVSRVAQACTAPAALVAAESEPVPLPQPQPDVAPAAAVPMTPPVAAISPVASAAGSEACPVSARGSEVREAPASLDAVAITQLRCAVEAWRRAWESGDVAAYEQSYDATDAGAVARSKAWKSARSQRLRNADIAIRLSAITLADAGDGLVSAEFQQDYRSRSYRDRGTKRLTWKHGADGWKIVSETFDRS